MASENGIVGEGKRGVEKVENGGEKEEKDVELVGEEEREEGGEEKGIEKAESDSEKAESEEEEKGGDGEEEEEEKKWGDEKVEVKKRRRRSSVREALITPNGRPSRERKTVERYMEMSDLKSSAGKAVLIEKVFN